MLRRILILGLLFTAGCGSKVKPADDQTHAQLVLPEYEAKGKAPFALTDRQSELLFKANILFWGEDVSQAQIQRVSKASVNGRLVRARFLKFLRDEKVPVLTEIKGRQVSAKKFDTQVVKSRQENFKDIVDLQRPLLESWLPSRLKALKDQGKITEGDVATANAQFDLYCQAKLWETAANPFLKLAYASRPTPLIMCEPYYERAKLLDKTTAACKDAADGQKKNYLNCFWQEGVVRTAIFAERDDPCSKSNNTPRNSQVETWVASGQLQTVLMKEMATTRVFEPGSVGMAVTSDTAISTTTDENNPLFFAQACRNAFKATKNASDIMRLPLGKLLNIVEVTAPVLKLNVNGIATLLPSHTDDGSDVVARYLLLGNDLMTFALRSGGPSVNDRIFNNNDQHSVREAEDIRAQYALAPGFATVRQVEADYVPDNLRDAKAANSKRLSDLESVVKDLDKQEFELNTALIDVLTEGALATMDPGVSLTFVNFTLKLTKIDDRLEVRLQIRDGRGAIGCVSLSGTACTAQRRDEEKDWSDLSALSFNADSNALVFDLLLDDPAAQGFAFKSEATKINLIPAADLHGRILRFSAYSNRLQDVLDFFTGKVELIEDGVSVREGSISGDAYGSNEATWK